MIILKLLNRNNLILLVNSILLFSTNIYGEDEPVDIWELEKKNEQNSSTVIIDSESDNEDKIEINNENVETTINIIDSNQLDNNTINIVGLYDPEENGLNIDMWSNSNGD